MPANDGCHASFAAWGMHTPLRPSALTVMLETVTLMCPLVAVIEGHDKDLARQIRRAANSVALNLAEAAGSDRGNRRARLLTALGSARETRTGFQLAMRWGYHEGLEAEQVDAALDRVAAMTFGLLRR
jgi:four helix bundle protein